MKKVSFLLIVLLLSLAVLLADTNQALAEPSTIRVSLTHDGQQANQDVMWPDISSNGRYVVFASAASNLLPDELAGPTIHIFLRDLQTGAISLISQNSSGAPGDDSSFYPVVSGDGRYVAFASNAGNLVSGDGNNASDVFVYDGDDGSLSRVSVATDGSEGNSVSWEPAIAADGSAVAFESYASNLVAADTNNVRDVFLHELASGVTERVSLDSAGQQADKQSLDPDISGDGRFVVFTSAATLTGATNRTTAIYLRDRTMDTTTRISPTDAGLITNGDADDGYISEDGRYVAYASVAHNIVDDDTNDTYDVFLYDRDNGATQRVSVDSNGAEADDQSQSLGISGNGRYVLFSSDATNLVGDDANSSRDIFLRDLWHGETVRVSLAAGGDEANGNSSGPAGINENGRYIVYQSGATNLVASDTNNRIDVFLRDQDDIFGPLVTDLQVAPDPTLFGEPVDITAAIDETGQGDANIAGAQYRAGEDDWLPLAARDGAFDSATEEVVIALPNGFDFTGARSVCVRGVDAWGNEGTPVCTEATVEKAPITLTITRITNFSIQLDDLSEPDFYVKVWIAPIDLRDPPQFNNEAEHTNDTASVQPFWIFSNTVDEFSNYVVGIEVWDKDVTSADDLADVNPDPAKEGLVFSIDMTSGKWSGDVEWPQNCSRGEGDTAVEVCWEISVMAENGDADGDGLHDSWEKYGLNADGDDVIEVNLPLMGADPLHKDIFVEIDYMAENNDTSFRPLPEAIETVVDSFANAPVTNPDGSSGIHLHVDFGPDAPLTWGDAETWGDLSQADVIPFQWNFGACTTNEDDEPIYEWEAVDDLKPTYFNTGRAAAFHYNPWVSRLCPEKGSTLGISRGIEASDFIVALRGWQRERVETGTFMHELGHNLGLRHGGADDINHKPNYLSIMNYSYTTLGLYINNSFANYDFSRYALPDLDEQQLDETMGLNAPPAITDNLGSFHYCPADDDFDLELIGNNAVDWNCDGDTDDTAVIADINDDEGAEQLLSSQTDWDKLVYTGGVVGAFATPNPLPPTTIIDDITEEDLMPLPEIGPQPLYLPFIFAP